MRWIRTKILGLQSLDQSNLKALIRSIAIWSWFRWAKKGFTCLVKSTTSQFAQSIAWRNVFLALLVALQQIATDPVAARQKQTSRRNLCPESYGSQMARLTWNSRLKAGQHPRFPKLLKPSYRRHATQKIWFFDFYRGFLVAKLTVVNMKGRGFILIFEMRDS